MMPWIESTFDNSTISIRIAFDGTDATAAGVLLGHDRRYGDIESLSPGQASIRRGVCGLSCSSFGQPTVVSGTAGVAVGPEYQEPVFRDCEILTPGPCQPVDATIGLAGIRSSRQQQKRRPFSHDGGLLAPSKRLDGPGRMDAKELIVAVALLELSKVARGIGRLARISGRGHERA